MKDYAKYIMGLAIGVVSGFLINVVLFQITDINVFNFFFTPLFDIFPVTYIVPVTFSVVGGLLGLLIVWITNSKSNNVFG